MEKEFVCGVDLTDARLKELAGKMPQSQDDPGVRAVAKKRREYLRSWLEAGRIDGIIIARRDNFAWLTCGGAGNVMLQSEYNTAYLLLTPEKQYLLAYTMDAGRILDEQIPAQGYEPVIVKWYQGDPRQKAFSLAGKNLVSDTPFEGIKTVNLAHMHGGLEEIELNRSRWLGHMGALIFESLVRSIRPGMAENSIARLLHATLIMNGIDPEVIITGSEGRVEKYWHALPSGKAVQSYALIHAAASRWGLHANINRLVSFIKPPEAIKNAHHAAAVIEARVIGMLRAGAAYADILQRQKEWYGELGYPDNWEYHFQGGPTGYFTCDAERCLTNLKVEMNQAFDWFITVGGIQAEELSLLTESGPEVASLGNAWPRKSVETENGEVAVPDIFVF